MRDVAHRAVLGLERLVHKGAMTITRGQLVATLFDAQQVPARRMQIDITGPSWRQHVAKTRAASRAPTT